MVNQDSIKSPHTQKRNALKQPEAPENGEKLESLFTPRFRSVAAMAGWDEESLLIASLIVEDTPDRLSKQKTRSDLLHFKTPPTNSRRKRRAQKRSPVPMPVAVLDLDEGDTAKQEGENKKAESKSIQILGKGRAEASIPMAILDLDEEDAAKQESEKKAESNSTEILGKQRAEASEKQGFYASSSNKKIESIEKTERKGADASKEEQGCSVSSSSSAFPSIDKLREELSCAICLEICFEPSTTPCGHSFCKKCLRSAAERCGKKCPKCRQLISNGRSCTVNTVLWNTIQLLFPKEVEARKASPGALSTREAAKHSSPVRAATHTNSTSSRRSRVLALNSPESITRIPERRNSRAMRRRNVTASRNGDYNLRRELPPNQDEDAAMVLRLQRQEFVQSFTRRDYLSDEQRRNNLALARANLRAMASRAINIGRGR